jgi:hypothetical protein
MNKKLKKRNLQARMKKQQASMKKIPARMKKPKFLPILKRFQLRPRESTTVCQNC